MADMIGIGTMLERRIAVIEKLEVQYVCVHTAHDLHVGGASLPDELVQAKKAVSDTALAVAGGIHIATIARIAREKPGIIIVGGALTENDERLKTAQAMKAIMHEESGT